MFDNHGSAAGNHNDSTGMMSQFTLPQYVITTEG